MSLLLALAGSRAAGQQSFELGEDDRWSLQSTPDPGTPEGQLEAVRRELARERYQRAEALATRWIEQQPGHPLLAEAYLLRGDSLKARRSYYEALFDYEFVAVTFTGSEAFVRALEREYEIALLFANGTRRKLWGMRIVSATEEAEELLIRIQERLPGSRLAENAGMTLGDFYFSRRQMDLAAEMYGLFIQNFPRSERIGKARKRLIYAYLASFKGPEFDGRGLAEARTRLQTLEIVDPVTAQQIGARALMTRIDESEARKMLSTARWYAKTKDYIAAELTLRRLLREHPRTATILDAVRLGRDLVPRLPASVLAEAPDYAALAALVDGETPPGDDEASEVRDESDRPPPVSDEPASSEGSP